MVNINGPIAVIEFLGPTGKPVPKQLAQSRAAVCSRCPFNVPPHSLQEKLSTLILKAAFAIFKLKTHTHIKIETEPKLGICKVCGCFLPLKIFVPLEHILKFTPDSTLNCLAPNCWILNE